MMEIDFLIQWKNKVTDKTDLAKKIKEMLMQLFSNIDSNKFSCNLDDGNTYDVDYKYSEQDEKIYLKISCDYSEAKSAKLLSNIRDIICKGNHRKDYLIICTYDGASLSYCCRLMKPLGTFERHLRELMYLITIKAFGGDWVDKTFSKEMIDKLKEEAKKSGNQSLTEVAFELLTYNEICLYLFSERYIGYSAEQILENKLSDNSLKTLSKEEIIEIISNSRKDTLWNKLFSKNKSINNITADTINTIRKYRNDVMHQHTLNEDKSKEIRNIVKQADQSIIVAIKDLENKIYTETEYISVCSTMNNVIPELIKAFSNLPKINIVDISDSISIAMNKFSELTKSISDIFSYDFLDNIRKAFSISMPTMPDYSKLLETYKYPSELLSTPLIEELSEKLDESSENVNNNTAEQ